MNLTMLHSKIHRATVTHSELDYNGSMGVDVALMNKAGLRAGQQVDVLNVNNGERFTTYLIPETAGSKTFGIYGAAAHKASVGDIVIIIAYASMTPDEAQSYTPTTLVMNEFNEIEREL